MLKILKVGACTYFVQGLLKTGRFLDVKIIISDTGKILKTRGITPKSPYYQEFLSFLRENKLIY